MKNHTNNKVVYLTALCLLILVGTGFTKRHNLIKEGLVTINKIDNGNFKFGSLYAYQKEGTLKISGKGLAANSSIKGHVDIAITRQDGSIIKKVSVPIRRKVNRRSQRTNLGRKMRFFSLNLPIHLPADTKITIAFHKKTNTAQKYFNCGNNMAYKKIKKN